MTKNNLHRLWRLSPYSNLPSVHVGCRDHILRSAARIPKFSHVITYMLEVLHWLPVRQRVLYRIASMVWRCQLGLAPTYLIDLVDLYPCAHT